MKRKRLVISAKTIDTLLISYASVHKSIDGVIIGDPFCLSRARIQMFDIPRLMSEAKKRGLYTVLQTPVYLTSRNYNLWMSLAKSLVSDKIVDEIRIQDLGYLKGIYPLKFSGIILTWSIWGYPREFPGMDIPINQGQIDFLKKQGIDNFELITPVVFTILEKRYALNLDMQIRHQKGDPISFSRRCYTKHFTGKCCYDMTDNTGKLPCDEEYYLQNQDKTIPPYKVDGHKLLEKIDPTEILFIKKSNISADALVLYGKDIEEINSLIEEWK